MAKCDMTKRTREVVVTAVRGVKECLNSKKTDRDEKRSTDNESKEC